jgi:hypothetical protein
MVLPCNYLIYLYNLMMAWLLENAEFVESEGETIQIPSCSKGVAPFRTLLIRLRVRLNEHENQIADVP